MRLVSSLLTVSFLIAACSSTPSAGTATAGSGGHGAAGSTGAGAKDAGEADVLSPADGSIPHPCDLPGSVQFTSTGTMTVPGGDASWASLAFLHLPPGFCAHYFGTVGNARQIRFAPGGELFVASPTAPSTGGGDGGMSAYVILPDNDLDGVADAVVPYMTFAVSGATNQGMLFANGYFYYQDGAPPGTKIMRVPYAPGDLKPSGASEQVADIDVYTSGLHWVKTMDVADDGTIYVGNGGDQNEMCTFPHPFHGGILQIDPAPGGPNPNGKQVAQGFRNPIAVRCSRGKNLCFTTELALDYSGGTSGGREKLVPIRQGDDWGFPCCATHDVPYPGAAFTDCSMVQEDTASFLIGDTPFGVDFEGGYWPATWNHSAFVVTHGAFGSWIGARIVAIQMDPTTGLPVPSTNKDGTGNTGGMTDFATGWDDGTLSHGRPAAVTFAPDSRLFVANDNNGVIFWIAAMN